MHIVIHRGTYHVERRARVWASVVSSVMFALWLVTLLGAILGQSVAGGLVWTLVLGVPSFVLSYTLGVTKRYRIAAVVEARDVPGGSFLAVMDDRNRRHELVVDPAIARGVTVTLTDVS